MESIKHVLIREITNFYEVKLQKRHQTQTSAVESNTILGKIFLEVDQEKKEMIYRHQQSHKY